MTKGHAKINEIKAAIKKFLPKAISQKILEFNKAFQQLGSKPEEEQKHEQERKMFEEARKGLKTDALPITKEEKQPAEASAWNANAYHWEEKAVSEWATTRLKELLKGCQFEADGCKASVSEITNFSGDVIP